MKKMQNVLWTTICAIFRLPLVLLLSLICIPGQMLGIIMGITCLIATGSYGINLIIDCCSILSVLGCIVLIIAGIALCALCIETALGDTDDERRFLSLWLLIVPKYRDKYLKNYDRYYENLWRGFTNN